MAIISISGKKGSGKDTIGKIIKYLIVENARKKDGRESLGTFNKKFVYNTYPEYNFQIKKFADKLKDIVCLLIGCTREQLEDREFKEKELGEEWWVYKVRDTHNGQFLIKSYLTNDFDELHRSWKEVHLVKMTCRIMLQLLGTEAGRSIIHPNIWVNGLFSNYKSPCHNAETKEPCSCMGVMCMKPVNWIITDMRFPNELKAVKDKGGITIRVNREYKYGDLSHIPITVNKVLNREHPSETALDNAEFDYIINNNGTVEDLIEKVKQILIKENII